MNELFTSLYRVRDPLTMKYVQWTSPFLPFEDILPLLKRTGPTSDEPQVT